MRTHLVLTALVGCHLAGISAQTAARDPTPPERVARVPRTEVPNKLTNLRVLSKDSSPSDIEDLMEEYNQQLGVSCDYCHSQDPRTRKLDYAADDNPAKQTARVMIAMLDEARAQIGLRFRGE